MSSSIKSGIFPESISRTISGCFFFHPLFQIKFYYFFYFALLLPWFNLILVAPGGSQNVFCIQILSPYMITYFFGMKTWGLKISILEGTIFTSFNDHLIQWANLINFSSEKWYTFYLHRNHLGFQPIWNKSTAWTAST